MKAGKISAWKRIKSLDKLVEYFDTHDMSEILEKSKAVHFDFDIREVTIELTLEADLFDRLSKLSSKRRKPLDKVVNQIVREKLTGT